MLLDSITGPADLRGLSYAELDELAVEIRQFIVDAVDRTSAAATWAPTSGPSSSRSPCTGSSTRPATSSCGTPATRPTSTRSSPAAPATSATCARPAASRATRPGPSPSTTGSRTATPPRSSPTPTAWPWPRSAEGGDGPPGRGRDRRRLADRRHGLRGPQQPRPLRQARRSSSSTTTAGPTPRPSRKLGESLARLRVNPTLPAQPGPPRPHPPRGPGGRPPARAQPRRLRRRHARDVRAAGVLRDARRALHGPVRRPRHRGHGEGAAQRGRATTARSSSTSLTQKGRGYAPAENDAIKHLHDIGPALPSPAATPPRSPRR